MTDNTDKNKINESTLLSYLNGTATPGDIEAVSNWLKESPDNEKILEDMYYIVCATERLDIERNADGVRSFKEVKNKINKNKRKRFFIICQKAAAVLFIPLVCALTLLLLKPSATDSSVIYHPVTIQGNPGTVGHIFLPDSSEVWLGSKAEITYLPIFEKERSVKVEGKVYMSVRKDASKPFMVNITDHFQLEVLGTQFNIEAYKTDSLSAITLVEGSVRVTGAKQGSLSRTLKPGEQIILNQETGKYKVHNVNLTPIISWKDGKIVFDNTPMTDAIKVIEERYNAKVIVNNGKYMNYRYTGTFIHQQLPQILEHFRISSGIKYEINYVPDNDKKGLPTTVVIMK